MVNHFKCLKLIPIHRYLSTLICFQQQFKHSIYLQVSLTGQGQSFSEIVVAGTSGFNYASFTSLSLPDGLYEVAVQAVNEIHMYSQRKTTKLILLSNKPELTGKVCKSNLLLVMFYYSLQVKGSNSNSCIYLRTSSSAVVCMFIKKSYRQIDLIYIYI